MLLVQDTLSPYSKAARYAAFVVHEARQLTARNGCHLTPKLALRLNAWELEHLSKVLFAFDRTE
ncbi:hypothetical protein ACFP9V_25125 [Deinococcus radiopugnans]|uniref:Uncharacterized protein n=1 Tax=Deinococcus radiopugnans ATCC 19172 TaxID=585398 RepID=A0A5C4XM35_9DEIO|nr:hypothetical protein [Deinococcus radiopugnans]MBB6018759.1 hypothetical protein [Deinococcus radiopugnans ATCC 19172]TNM64367.1 hypothetical protein FHR04_19710 [Deinococcus radiopugnans ATCC 19172]